jgi:hypothetical protein
MSVDRTAPKPTSRRFWFDPRFAIGLVLVLASVAGVVGLVSSASAMTPAYAASGALAPGDRVTGADLVPTLVRIDSVSGRYLVPGDVPDEGFVITKPIGAGELVPVSAVGSTAGLDVASIVVSTNAQLPESTKPGDTVDVWASSSLGTGLFGPPSVIVPGATVVRVVVDDGIVKSSDGATVEILVPRLRIARLLSAIANDDALSIVPASIPGIG